MMNALPCFRPLYGQKFCRVGHGQPIYTWRCQFQQETQAYRQILGPSVSGGPQRPMNSIRLQRL